MTAGRKEKPLRLHRDIDRHKRQKVVPLYRVAFLVSRSIPESNWQVDSHEDDPNRTLLATLNLTTTAGPIAIHNAYNAFDSAGKLTLNIDALLQTCTDCRNDLLLGHLNFHHELRGGPRVEPNHAEATKLCIGMQAAEMHCLLDPKKITSTYSRGTDTSKHLSTIDLAFAGPRLYPRFVSYRVVTGVACSCRPEIMKRWRDRIVPINKPPQIIVKVMPEKRSARSVAKKLNTDRSAEETSGVYTMAKLGTRLSIPREAPHIPDLEEIVPHGIRKQKTNAAKAEFIVKTIWPQYSCGKGPAPVLECPPLDSAWK
ncbi:zinc knuckle [Colletotrichum incanum]|uniref:Zinc knuckle n=1 Tax=Colletotrichum incanum TaxID=1573173 RepID=A0A162PAH3_COLIC|nr:zinc knuckle [Colletotrichum incanum]